jgi:excisionase family DNA binding protein
MQAVTITQITALEFQSLIEDSVRKALSHHTTDRSQPEADKLMTIEQAAAFLSLSVPTLYTQTSKAIIPCMKKGKRLYFSKDELTDWIKQGRKQSSSEITSERDNYLKASYKKKNGNV